MSQDEEELTLPPYVVAGLDQDKAKISHLIGIVREHMKTCKTLSQPCPGKSIFLVVDSMSAHEAKRLLLVALSMSGREEPLWHEV